MDIVVVKFKSSYKKDSSKILYGLKLIDESIFCFENIRVYEKGKYSIIEEVEAECENMEELWSDVSFREYEELFED